MGRFRVGLWLMEWRLKRNDGAAPPQWARYEFFDRHWSWTADESEAFAAHNPYIAEAMQRRMPDYMRAHCELEQKPENGSVETPRAETKRPTKRGR